MKYIGENAIKKLISLIKGDLATKQPTITATGVLERDTTGVINGVETVGATLVETQEAKLVDVPNGLLKGDGTTISAAVAGTDYVNSNQAIRYDAAQSLTDAQKTQARGNIGAAPAGFGLGATAKFLTSADDANDIWQSGWYRYDSDNIPQNGITLSYLQVMRVDGYSSGVFVQTVYGLTDSENYQICSVARRFRYTTKITPWEWVNPPLILGVEYRTTERYLGYPVYVKLVDFGALPNAGSEKTISVSDLGIFVPISMNLTWGNLALDHAVINDSADYISDAQFTNSIIRIVSSSNVLESYKVYALLKYSKRT